MAQNSLFVDREADFWLGEVLDLAGLFRLPAFCDHSIETCQAFVDGARRLAREVLLPAYRPLDESPPVLRDGRVLVHPLLREKIYPRLVEFGLITATRPAEVGGQSLPLCVSALAQAYLSAGNAAAQAYLGLTTGAAHLIEAFGDEALRRDYMTRMYRGEWTGTMALSEPHAGSSLADVRTRATPTAAGHYLIDGAKIFISGGDHDLTENVVHLVLARVPGAPAGTRGISLFAVPRLRLAADGALVDNDVRVTGLVHKIGWRGLPSLILSFGEGGDCHGYLVGQVNAGLAQMFQMMNEARLMVGVGGVGSAAVAYQESLAYARTRLQGRALSSRDPQTPQVPIIAHADVRRMLLRQKAIVEGGLGLILRTSRYADVGAAGDGEAAARARRLCDLLTPVAKSFPAEWGFESNALAVQIHGGYGYSSEYLPEAWLRDQKLNSIHEGTTGIQGLDLLGRKVFAAGGAALRELLGEEIPATLARARAAGVAAPLCAGLEAASAEVGALSLHLGQLGLSGQGERMVRHSAHYLQLFSILVIAWNWVEQAAVCAEGLRAGRGPAEFYEGKLCAAQYWIATELPRVAPLCALCRAEDDSYVRMQDAWF